MHGAGDGFGGEDAPHAPAAQRLMDEILQHEKHERPRKKQTVQQVSDASLIDMLKQVNEVCVDHGIRVEVAVTPTHSIIPSVRRVTLVISREEILENSDPIHRQRLAVMHAIWLSSYMLHILTEEEESKLDHGVVANHAAAMLGMMPDKLFEHINEDWMDRCWCSRPTTWKPMDSLRTLL
jgi:hypothetical protein